MKYFIAWLMLVSVMFGLALLANKLIDALVDAPVEIIPQTIKNGA
jgi:hypothetical protein